MMSVPSILLDSSLFSPCSNSSSNAPEPMSSYTHCDFNHPDSLLSAINNMRDNNQLFDVSLRVGNSVTKAHRLLLASSSPYFYAMFNVDMAEKSQSEVEMHDIDSGALQLLVEFMYTSQVIITEENVRELLSASCFLQIDSARDACLAFLKNQLRPTNCVGIRRFAETYSHDDLSHQAFLYALKKFETVVNCEEFLDLSFSEIENLVSQDKLNVLSEEQVYAAVIRWIKHDLAERLQYIEKLFGHLRLAQMSKEFLFDVVYKEPLVCNELSNIELWVDAVKYQDFPERRSDLSSKRTEPRLGGLGVFAIGGATDKKFYNRCERYDFVKDRWRTIAPMSQCRAYAGIASLGGLIYAIGGYDGKVSLSSAECYDPISNKWSPIKALDSKRSSHSASAINGHVLYVCGGVDEYVLNSVVCYDPLADVWLPCPSMNTRRRDCCVSIIDNCLYAIGGRQTNNTNYLSTVERYDPRMCNWMAVPDMSSPRSSFSAATLDNTLYCVGGKIDANKVLSSGERLNVRRNAWEPICNMPCGRTKHGMVAVNEGLLVLGGEGNGFSLNSTERYDPRNDQWETATPMRKYRVALGAALVQYGGIDSKLKPVSEITQYS